VADKYHYDSKGNFTGKTSDDPPGSTLGGAIVLIFIVVVLLSMCSSNKSDSNGTKAPVTNSNKAPATESSNKDPGPKWTVPQEEATTKSTQWTAPSPAPSPAPQTEQPKQWTIPKED